MIKSVLFTLLLSCCCSAVAQQFSFIVQTKGFSPTDTIVLTKYHGTEEIPVDSIYGSGKGVFNVNIKLPIDGLYFISYARTATAELILSERERSIAVSIDKDGLAEGRVSIENSIENDAYKLFVELYLDYEQTFYSKTGFVQNIFSPTIISEIQDQSNMLEATQAEFNDKLSELVSNYPNTYSAKVLCQIASLPTRTSAQQIEFETYTSFLNQHYWDNVVFSDSLLLNHFLLNEALKNYFRHFVPKQEEHLKAAIDLLHSYTKNSSLVSQHVRSFLLRNFLNANASTLSAYVSQLTDDDACELGLSEEQLSKLSNITTVIDSGSKLPPTVLPDRDMQNVELADVYTNSKLTLIIFWSAKCIHCLNELPEIDGLYQQFHPKGLEIFAINLDENKFDFREYLDQKPNNWINVTDIGPISDSEIIKAFNVQKTPSTFIANSAGVVIGKNLLGSNLQDFVSTYLDSR